MNSATTLAALVAHCRKLTRRLQTTHASLASKLILAAMPLVMAGVLGFGAFRTLPAEPPRENLARAKDSASKSPAAERAESRLDRFGDPLPPGAIRRFGTVRFRHHDLFDVAFTPDGKQLIVGDGCSPLAVFDAITGRKLREVGKSTRGANSLTGFALSPDGKQVVCCGSDVFVWDLATGRLIRQLHCGLSREVAFTSDGARLAAAVKETSRGAITGIVVVEAASGKHMANWTVLNQQEIEQNRFYSISFSPDGKFLAGLFSQLREEKPAIHKVYTSKVWLLDAATGKRIRIFGSDDIPVVSFAFQPNTGRLATFGKDGILRFWDVETGKEVQQFPAAKGTEGNSFGALRFSADGRRCAVLTDRGKFITVLDTKEGRLVRRVEEEESRMRVALALSPDGKAIASARLYDASCVRVWEVDSGIERLANAGHRAAPTALSLSSDSRTLLSRDERGREYIWDLRSGKGITRSVGVREVVGDFIWSSDFSHKSLRGPRWRLVYKNQRPAMMEVWSLDGKKLIRKAEAHGPMVPTVALSPDGAHLALTARNVNNANSTVMLWNPERDEKPRALPSKPDGFSQLLFSHDGKKLIGRAGWGNPRFSTGSVWIWDVATTRLLHKLPINTAPGHLQLTTDDRVLLLCGLGNDATVHAWDLESGQELARLTDPALKPPNDSDNYRTQPAITGLAPSADGRFLAVVTSWGDVSALSIWETGSWKLVRAFPPVSPRTVVRAMVFSRDGRSLFAANSDSTILEWDVSGRFGKEAELSNMDRLNALWRLLMEAPDQAYPAAWELLDHPAESVPFLIGKLAPVKPIEAKKVRRWLAQLDSESFAEREEASRQLQALGEQALPLLRQALQDKPSLETEKRIKRLIESLTHEPSAEQRRLLRALAVLEWSNSREAGEHLRRLAEGDPAARLTRAAKEARQRR